MDSDTTICHWLEASKPLVHSLADAVATTCRLLISEAPPDRRSLMGLSGALKQMREWLSAHPCPEATVADRVQMMVARVGFVSLVLGSDDATLDRIRIATMGKRLRELDTGLSSLMTEIEQSVGRDWLSDASD